MTAIFPSNTMYLASDQSGRSSELYCYVVHLGIEGKVAVVTGGSRGLGMAVAETLSEEGAEVFVVARSKVARDASSLPAKRLSFLQADLSVPGEVDALIAKVSELGIRPQILVNNVGGNLGMSTAITPHSEFWEVMNFNLMAAIKLNEAWLPSMIASGWGRICHISSISSLENQGVPSYGAAKSALNAYVRSVGRFVSKHGVIMNSVLPGAVLTQGGYWDELTKQDPERVERYVSDRMAIGRLGRPSEIAGLVAFMVSEHASFMVGSSVLADGGQGRVFETWGYSDC